MSCPAIALIQVSIPGPEIATVSISLPGPTVASIIITTPDNPGAANQLAPGFSLTFSPPDHTATHAIVHYLGLPIASIPLSILPS
jgi:hypothetical protein